jgi:hypothetical protein
MNDLAVSQNAAEADQRVEQQLGVGSLADM